MAGADVAGFSDLSDSELLQAEEPREAEEPRSARDPEGAGKRKRAQRPLDRCALRYLCVTDLAGQSWCEQQMVLGMEQPRPLAPETAALLDAGKSIHLARELEVHDLVKIPTTSREDSWAIKILNLLSVIPVLQAGGHVRELPVFGVIEGVFVSGIIDELRYNTKGELELNELKTRSGPFMPGKAQRKKDHFQVSLYKYIFDTMVQGQLKPDVFTNHIQLRPEQPLGCQLRKHAQKIGFMVTSFGDLLELMHLNLMFSDIPGIDCLKIEYRHQESSVPLGTEVVPYEEATVKEKAQYYLAYWKGQREVRGVDIEEAWKCQSCGYSEICDWRKKRAEGLEKRNEPKKSK
ncbi:PREDICTED: exonuclease V [Gavialis gangeticus]|uniref:exonuclease V n=1 Tax=Gavialis gangeticus TaxID=94835 RepID=UPI00092EF83E|nr:PREDICTED: exonuclease V [Gavialis gangeticus]